MSLDKFLTEFENVDVPEINTRFAVESAKSCKTLGSFDAELLKSLPKCRAIGLH